VYRNDYQAFGDAEQRRAYFIDAVYTTKRVHSCPGYLPPTEFETASEHTIPRVVVW
jgi:hypothetical protein